EAPLDRAGEVHGGRVVGPVDLDQGVEPAEELPVDVEVGVEEVGIDVARAYRELVAGRRQDVEAAELLADGHIGGQVGRAAALDHRGGAAGGLPAQAGRQQELVGDVLDPRVLGEPAEVEPALAGPGPIDVRVEGDAGATSAADVDDSVSALVQAD